MNSAAIPVGGLESFKLDALARRPVSRLESREGLTMNPLVTAAVAAVARWLITIAAAQGVALSDDQSTQIVSGVVAAAMLAWSLRHKVKVDEKIKSVEAERAR